MAEFLLEFEKPLAELRKKIDELKNFTKDKSIDAGEEIKRLEEKAVKMKDEIYSGLTPWQVVQIMRHPHRPKTLDFINLMLEDFKEMHGDRAFKDDKAMVGGMARLEGRPVMAVGLQKGKDTKENLLRNFGCGFPEGYRKALRLMKLAEKFGMPVLTFIDTTGAFPGIEGEERGVAEAIARNLLEMSRLKVPIIVCVIGEGGSGGALGIGVGDRILMMKYATYSVISFEGCAAIIWRDASKAPDAVKALKATADDLYRMKIIDKIIDEPMEGAHTNHKAAAENLKKAIAEGLDELCALPEKGLVKKRYEKFRKMGVFSDEKK